MATNTPFETKTIPSGDALTAAIWHRCAPASVLRAYRAGKAAKGWAAWTKHLARRRRPIPLEKLLPDCAPLRWALGDEATTRGTLDLLNGLACFGSKRSARSAAGPSGCPAIAEWLSSARAAGAVPDACWAIEAIAWCHALPKLAASVGADAWWTLLDHLVGAVDMTAQVDPAQDPLAHQLIAGELALTLGYLLPEVAPCRKAAGSGRRALGFGLVELTDGEGFLHGRHLDLLRPLLACWTRCRAMGGELPKGSWNKEAENQYQWLVRHALRLTRHDGSQSFAGGSAGARCDSLLRAALDLGGNQADWNVAALALPGGKKRDASRASKLALPGAAYHSPWGAAGVLRSGWSREDPRLVAVYAGRQTRLEVECRKRVLFSGAWGLEVRRGQPAVGSEPIRRVSEWTEICWTSDDDMDYLELEIELSGSVKVQRHMALARRDQFLFLADAVLGSDRTEWAYRGTLPLGEEISLQPAVETREGLLVDKKPAALVLPLALPEWRCDPRGGTLRQSDGSLELCQSARGSSLFAPLFIDLAPRRAKRPFTWRRLTVAESLQIQPDDVAVGYRVQVGRRQWLIYRSLAAKGNRTLLGHNLATDLLIARFGRDGEVETLVEIE